MDNDEDNAVVFRSLRVSDIRSELEYVCFRYAIVGYFRNSNQEDWESATSRNISRHRIAFMFSRLGWTGKAILPDSLHSMPRTTFFTLSNAHRAEIKDMTLTNIMIQADDDDRVRSMSFTCYCDDHVCYIMYSSQYETVQLSSATGEVLKIFDCEHDEIKWTAMLLLEVSIVMEHILSI